MTYEPQNNRTNIRLLRRILNPSRSTMSTMRSSLDRFESDIVEYESRGQAKPSDKTLRAVLLAMVPENLEEHLELNIQRFDTYSKMRSEVISFLEQKASKSMVDDGGAAPMDLDYVQGKGKGKSTKTCYTCGKVGHVSKDCWHGKSKGTSSSSSSKGSSSKGSSTGKGTKGSKESPKGKGKSSKGKGKSKMGSKSGKQYAVENQEDAQQWSEEPEAEGQETWNEEAWPNKDGQWEEQTGEQGAMCVAASADSAQQAPRQRELTKYEKALEGEQKEFMLGKIWKRPEVFWNMPFRLVCNQSCYDGKFYCGYQRCKHKGFGTPSQFNQHLRSKVGTHGHPDQEQIDAWERDPYEVAKGRRHYGLWDPKTGQLLNAKLQDWELDSTSLKVAIKRSKERMRKELAAKKPPAKEEATEVEKKKKPVLLKATPKVKAEKFGSKHVENVDDDSSEYTIDSQDIEEGESEAFEVKDEEVEVPEGQHEEPPEEPHDEPPEERPEETAEDLEALREEKGQDLAKKDIKALEKKKREEKEALQKKPVGFTPGAVAKFTQALIMQKLEEVKSIESTLALLDRDHPARKALEETIAQKKEEMKKIQAERQKARGKKHSTRQEMDKKEAGSRVAYIKERQRQRAADHRKSGFKERAIANVAKQEEAERRFNQPGTGVRVKTFPLAEKELSKEVEAAPMGKKEKAFIKNEQDEEFPEVKRRSMELPPSEKRRLKEKKAKFKEDKASKKSKTQQKRKEEQNLRRKAQRRSRSRRKKKQCPLQILKKRMMQKFKPCWLKLGSHQNKHLAVLVQHTRIASRRLTHPSTTVDHQRVGPASGKATGERGPIGSTTNGRATTAAHNSPTPQKKVPSRKKLRRDLESTSVIVVFKDH